MKEILQERRAWSFFERQYLEKDGINEKINIRFLQRIIFFVVLWILDGFGATFVQTKFFSSPVLINVSLKAILFPISIINTFFESVSEAFV